MSVSASVPLLGRAPWTSAGEVDAAQRPLIDAIVSAWGDAGLGVSPVDAEGRLTWPFDLMAASPVVGGAVLALARAFRDGLLTTAEREVAILVVAALDESPYMRAGDEPLAVAAGLESLWWRRSATPPRSPTICPTIAGATSTTSPPSCAGPAT